MLQAGASSARTVVAMASMGTGAWVVLWIFLGVAAAVVGGALAIRALGRCTRLMFPGSTWAESPAVPEAGDAPQEHADGEISREEHLRDKVELKA
jgi:hypothetical protein